MVFPSSHCVLYCKSQNEAICSLCIALKQVMRIRYGRLKSQSYLIVTLKCSTPPRTAQPTHFTHPAPGQQCIALLFCCLSISGEQLAGKLTPPSVGRCTKGTRHLYKQYFFSPFQCLCTQATHLVIGHICCCIRVVVILWSPHVRMTSLMSWSCDSCCKPPDSYLSYISFDFQMQSGQRG